ncbi:hypothetical protein LPJ72_006015, partial [Coemansia sp. Benny D160-2]
MANHWRWLMEDNLNDKSVNAVADTGLAISLITASAAEGLQLKVNKNKQPTIHPRFG